MKQTRLLFIGNSFTHRNDVPGTLQLLGAAAQPRREVLTQRVIANGMSLKTHWTRGEARREIASAPWDFVVLQEQSTLPLKNREKMHEYVTLFDADIKAAGARTMLYLTWARQNVFERQDELSDAYQSIAKSLGATVAPVGIAWKILITEHPDITLHDKDMSHPNAAGSYLAACVFFATLFKKTPAGLPGVAGVDPQRIGLLQHAAWRAVQSL